MKKAIFARLLCTVAVLAALTPVTAFAVPDDNLYVSANQGGSIFEYTPAGIQSTFASYPTKLPRGLAFDSNGNLFAAVSNFDHGGGSVNKFTPSSVRHTFGNAPGILEGVAIDTIGDVFVISQNFKSGPSAILKFTAAGTRSVFASLPGQSFGLAFNSAGNLFVSELGFPP